MQGRQNELLSTSSRHRPRAEETYLLALREVMVRANVVHRRRAGDVDDCGAVDPLEVFCDGVLAVLELEVVRAVQPKSRRWWVTCRASPDMRTVHATPEVRNGCCRYWSGSS